MFDYIPNAPPIGGTVRPKNMLALFPEIGQVKIFFITHPLAWSNVYQNIHF